MPDKKFETAFGAFMEKAQKIIDDYNEKSKFKTDRSKELLIAEPGKKFVRVVISKQINLGEPSRSVWCFVDQTNGDVLKAATWKAPAKHARGNIYDDTNGLGRCTYYGPEYLK